MQNTHKLTPISSFYNGLGAFVVSLASASLAFAQPDDRQSVVNGRAWYMYFGDHPLGAGPWGLHFDGQLRMEGAFERRNQLLLRPGVNFDANDSVQLSGGYAYVDTKARAGSPPGFDRPEHRLWEQLILRQRLGTVRLTHRYRLEQRFVGNVRPNDAGEGEPDGHTYVNRFRYFVKGTIPFSASSRYYAAFYNELMAGFGDNVRNNVFDQNRSYGALGMRLGPTSALEVGYLLQIVQEPSGSVIQYNHAFQVGWFSTRSIH